MNNRFSKTEYNRLKDVLLYDKINTPTRLSEVVKSDILDVLSNYIELIPASFKVELDVTEKGYQVSIQGEGVRLKSVGGI